jgi:hypothetical protein
MKKYRYAQVIWNGKLNSVRCYRDTFQLDSTDPKNVFNLKGILEKLVVNGEAGLQLGLDEVKKLSEEIPLQILLSNGDSFSHLAGHKVFQQAVAVQRLPTLQLQLVRISQWLNQ